MNPEEIERLITLREDVDYLLALHAPSNAHLLNNEGNDSLRDASNDYNDTLENIIKLQTSDEKKLEALRKRITSLERYVTEYLSKDVSSLKEENKKPFTKKNYIIKE